MVYEINPLFLNSKPFKLSNFFASFQSFNKFRQLDTIKNIPELYEIYLFLLTGNVPDLGQKYFYGASRQIMF